MPADIGELQDAAKSRREKLMAMRAKRKGGAEDSTEEPALKLRNYKPLDENIVRDEIEPADVAYVDEHVEELEMEASAPVPGEDTNELDLIQLAPKKPDWDLKRAIQPRLDRLNKKTERAIAELIRERLKGSADLAAQVAVAGPDVDFVDE
ncbi:unnamed protein product [Oikopleura dioica]|uniref:Coiled-coil domain-containing protein 12 n=1 Tax=Oikopleura dioica TaxID=34765 RepID=E4WWG7_OIKDI|nr:unnamed protein product [Oikopleura dioica]